MNITYADLKLVLDGFGKGEDEITPTEFEAYDTIRTEFRNAPKPDVAEIVWMRTKVDR